MSKEIERQTAAPDLMEQVRAEASKLVPAKLIKFNSLLEQKPRNEWIKKNAGIEYVPIRIVEDLLTSFFGDWSVEFPEGGTPRQLGNSIVCSVLLVVTNPVTGKERRLPGTGAVPIQLEQQKVDKDGNYKSGKRNNLDFENIVTTAIQKNAPAALSFAISNAAKKLGRIFGGNLTQESDFYLGVQSIYESEQQLKVTTLQQADDEILRLLNLYSGDDSELLRSQFEHSKSVGEWSLDIALKAIEDLKKLIIKSNES